MAIESIIIVIRKGDKMEEHTKETVTTEERGTGPAERKPAKRESTGPQTIEYVVYFVFGVLDILLAFRLILRLLGAGTSSSFVNFIYNLSGAFIWPFQGIFSSTVAPGAETVSVFEPATLIAIIVYAILAWGIVQLVRILSGERQE